MILKFGIFGYSISINFHLLTEDVYLIWLDKKKIFELKYYNLWCLKWAGIFREYFSALSSKMSLFAKNELKKYVWYFLVAIDI